MQKNNKVILGFSGGVDSTVAALLLKEQNYDVIGYFFDVLGTNEFDIENAKKVAKEIGIELIVEDVTLEFEKTVVQDFCCEYRNARTPNPCIICNPNIKFKKMIETADKNDAFYIATGHYAQIIHDKDGTYYVGRAKNKEKDQSYMLYRLDQDVLKRLIFPLGKIRNKEYVRKIAKKHGLSNSNKKDSQEICFVPDGLSYIDVLKQHNIASEPGDFVDLKGNVIGKHRGIINYTIGQRKGLGVSFGKPVFVTKIDPKNNTVTLGDKDELMNSEVSITDTIFVSAEKNTIKSNSKYLHISLKGKGRYSAPLSKCEIINSNENETLIKFAKDQKSLTPGQSIVLYKGKKVIGGGFIK